MEATYYWDTVRDSLATDTLGRLREREVEALEHIRAAKELARPWNGWAGSASEGRKVLRMIRAEIVKREVLP